MDAGLEEHEREEEGEERRRGEGEEKKRCDRGRRNLDQGDEDDEKKFL